MAAFYLDEDQRKPLSQSLQALGHDVEHTKGSVYEGDDDAQQLLTASRHGRILVTHNRRDFQRLHRAWHIWAGAWRVTTPHAGIIHIPQEWSAVEAGERITALVAQQPRMDGRMLDWDSHAKEFRALPIPAAQGETS